MARAMESRCIMPPENPRTIWSPRSVSLKRSSKVSARSLRVSGIDAEIGAVEQQNFAGGESEVKVRPLLHYSDQPLDHDLLGPHIMLANPRLAARGTHARGENSHRGRLAGAVWSQQSEDFAGRNSKREAVESNDLRFGLFVLLAAPAPEAEAAARSQRRRRVVDFS
jgi:hypothetical protein